MQEPVNLSPPIVEKYTNGFMYVEYPHKSTWSEKFGDHEYRQALRKLFKEKKEQAMLYVHIPFCPKLCLFCLCHTVITKNYPSYQKYLSYLFREIDLMADFFKSENITPQFQEIHLGGGSPSVLLKPEFDQLIEHLGKILDVRKLGEFSLEIDPRNLIGREDMLPYYHSKGITRISMGIQDFDPQVQRAVNRIQPPELVAGLLTPEVRKLFPSVNFDVLVGLPKQTEKSFAQTIEKVIEIGPDRIDLAFFNRAPRNAPHMEAIKIEDCPNDLQRHNLFLDACRRLTAAGYVRIGFDHFARSTDRQAKAMAQQKLRWNSLGFSPQPCASMVGLGVNSGMRLTEEFYAQNVYPLEDYEKLIDQGKFPIFRGMHLSADDIIRREVINSIRSYYEVDKQVIEKQLGKDFGSYFSQEIEVLKEFEKDGIVKCGTQKIEVTPIGRHFCNLVCRVFDNYNRGLNYTKHFFEINRTNGHGITPVKQHTEQLVSIQASKS